MKQLFLALFILGVYAIPAQATPNQRGYSLCEQTIMKEFKNQGVAASRTYYYRKEADKNVYYINGSIWNSNGERVTGRATCFTSLNGRKILEYKTEFGSYAIDGNMLVVR